MKLSRKPLLAALAALGMTIAGVGPARADAVCGDLNGTGSLTAADCTRLFEVLAGATPASPPCDGAASGILECGDLNGDGAVNVADGVVCVGAVAGTTPLRCPGGTGGGGSALSCPGGSATISRNVTRSQTWPARCTIFIDGTVLVAPGVEVTIEPGTTIKGRKNSTSGAPSALIFQRGARINAAGTASAPIVFTSDQPVGTRTKGDWAGLVINGAAPVNVPGGEGLSEGLTGVQFGGGNPNDSSGVLRYVRVEFCGRELSTDNELNALTLNAVGAGTTLDHVQGHYGLDDSIEWFGGTVNGTYLVASACGDDCLDWQLGTTGAVQFALAAQYLPAVEAGGSNGIEADNNENGHNLLPRSRPRFCNVTLLGTRGQAGPPPATNMVGALLRRGTGGVVANAIVAGFHKVGIELRDNSTAAVGCTAGKTLTGDLLFRQSIFFNNGPTGHVHCGQASGTNTPCTGCELYDLWANTQGVVPDLCATGALGCQDQTPVVDPLVSLAWPPLDPRPAVGSPAASGALDCSTLDPFFTPTAYVGAFEPGGDNWLDTPGGWISFAVD
jgi:hypothetical protein